MENLSNAPTLAVALTLPLCTVVVDALQRACSEHASTAKYTAERADNYATELAALDADTDEEMYAVATRRLSYELTYRTEAVGRYDHCAAALAAFGVEATVAIDPWTLTVDAVEADATERASEAAMRLSEDDATAGSRDAEYANER